MQVHLLFRHQLLSSSRTHAVHTTIPGSCPCVQLGAVSSATWPRSSSGVMVLVCTCVPVFTFKLTDLSHSADPSQRCVVCCDTWHLYDSLPYFVEFSHLICVSLLSLRARGMVTAYIQSPNTAAMAFLSSPPPLTLQTLDSGANQNVLLAPTSESLEAITYRGRLFPPSVAGVKQTST